MTAPADPIAEFEELFARAKQSERDATEMALATADEDGRPSVRMVLLKQVDRSGFVFYTNYESRKALQLEANPHGALCMYWQTLGRQVRVEGPVARVSDAESDAYFASRPRGSRLGALASDQSRPLASRFSLLRRYVALQVRHGGGEIARPDFWGGYRLTPERIEFWDARRHRLHDRRLYRLGPDGWRMTRLYP